MLLCMFIESHSVSASNHCRAGITAVMYGMSMVTLNMVGRQKLHKTGMSTLQQQRYVCALLELARSENLFIEIQAAGV